MPIRTYDEALAFWYSRVNYEQQGMPQDVRTLRLDRMRLLMERLGQPQERFRSIHITGTKGKGSTAALITSVLQASDLKTGLFTSPHLVHVEERVQVNGRPISREQLTAALQRIENAVLAVEAAGEGPVTFFEIMTAVGFLHFAEQQVEWAVVEVGLGGRFDATNVLLPAVSVITSISFDHQQQLGHTLAAIAGEKAGIIKPGVPVVSGVRQPEPREVIRQRCQELGSPLFELERDFFVEHEPGDVGHERWPRVRFREGTEAWTEWHNLPLWGAPQAANAAVAWQTLRLLGPLPSSRGGLGRGASVPYQVPHPKTGGGHVPGLETPPFIPPQEVGRPEIATGFRQVHWPARLEIVQRRPWVIVDCAHNDASFAVLVDWLKSAIPARGRTLILALSKDKDLPMLVPLLVPVFDRAIMTRYSSSSRGADPELLAQLWRDAGGGSVQVIPTPLAAWQDARAQAGPEDLICVTGSVFLAGELRDTLRNESVRTQG